MISSLNHVATIAICRRGALLCGFTLANKGQSEQKPMQQLAPEEVYLTNYNGAQITKEHYLNLLAGFDPTNIYMMPADIVETYADDTTLYTTAPRGDEDVFYRNPNKVEMNYSQYKELVEKDYTPEQIDSMTQTEFESAIG